MGDTEMIVIRIRRLIKHTTYIPKPATKSRVKGWGVRRGEAALIYFIPIKKHPDRPSEKGVTESEFEQAYQQIIENGEFSRKWFDQNMQACSKEGGCNFTTIGGIFKLLGIADYKRGLYFKIGL
jgi:hypothetical protein